VMIEKAALGDPIDIISPNPCDPFLVFMLASSKTFFCGKLDNLLLLH
jgi:hypothetical protein